MGHAANRSKARVERFSTSDPRIDERESRLEGWRSRVDQKDQEGSSTGASPRSGGQAGCLDRTERMASRAC